MIEGMLNDRRLWVRRVDERRLYVRRIDDVKEINLSFSLDRRGSERRKIIRRQDEMQINNEIQKN
ncbi:MAG: hypothetical protein PHE88_01120 [Elusimicrobia bacterium]|nr:hypothetical protein [Elusimicrobiota bacterium]